jgi:hypothetical protein
MRPRPKQNDTRLGVEIIRAVVHLGARGITPEEFGKQFPDMTVGDWKRFVAGLEVVAAAAEAHTKSLGEVK